jgi:hypothetical protein
MSRLLLPAASISKVPHQTIYPSSSIIQLLPIVYSHSTTIRVGLATLYKCYAINTIDFPSCCLCGDKAFSNAVVHLAADDAPL